MSQTQLVEEFKNLIDGKPSPLQAGQFCNVINLTEEDKSCASILAKYFKPARSHNSALTAPSELVPLLP